MADAPVVEFAYALTGTGWSAGRLAVGSAWAELSASYLRDALGDLLRATLAIAAGDGEARCSWEEEPGEYRWILNRAGDALSVTVLEFHDIYDEQPDEAGKAVIDATCTVAGFIGAIAGGAQRLLDELGPDEYLKRWVDDPFPTEELAELQAWLNQSPLPPEA